MKYTAVSITFTQENHNRKCTYLHGTIDPCHAYAMLRSIQLTNQSTPLNSIYQRQTSDDILA